MKTPPGRESLELKIDRPSNELKMFNHIIKPLLVVGALIIALLIILFLIFTLYIPNSVISELNDKSCSGTLLSIKDNGNCMLELQVQQEKDTVSLPVSECVVMQERAFFDYVSIGDKVTKPKGEWILIVSKKNSETRTFTYPYSIK